VTQFSENQRVIFLFFLILTHYTFFWKNYKDKKEGKRRRLGGGERKAVKKIVIKSRANACVESIESTLSSILGLQIGCTTRLLITIFFGLFYGLSPELLKEIVVLL